MGWLRLAYCPGTGGGMWQGLSTASAWTSITCGWRSRLLRRRRWRCSGVRPWDHRDGAGGGHSMFALALEAVAVAEAAYNDRLPRHVVRYVEGELTYYSIHKDMVMDYIRQRDAILQQGRQWPELDVM